jgi:pimeloyl-ACP methyl ester carboxylesterase
MASGGLAWYRALAVGAGTVPGKPHPLRHNDSRAQRLPRLIEVPTTYLWGRDDPALGRAAAERSGSWVAADYDFVELEAGHWLPETRAAEVASAVTSRVRGEGPSRG